MHRLDSPKTILFLFLVLLVLPSMDAGAGHGALLFGVGAFSPDGNSELWDFNVDTFNFDVSDFNYVMVSSRSTSSSPRSSVLRLRSTDTLGAFPRTTTTSSARTARKFRHRNSAELQAQGAPHYRRSLAIYLS